MKGGKRRERRRWLWREAMISSCDPDYGVNASLELETWIS